MRLLLLEDHPALSEAIASHLRAHGFVVDVFSTCRQAKAALDSEGFDIALIDLSLPDGDGLDLVKHLRYQGTQLPIIITTARDQIRDRIKGLEAGADDYLVKPFDLDEMIARIQAVWRRHAGKPSQQQSFGLFDIDYASRRVVVNGVDALLTTKEWALIEKLASRPRSLFSREQLEQAIYGFDDDVESNTLEVFISRLRKKLGKESIVTVRGVGYGLGQVAR